MVNTIKVITVRTIVKARLKSSIFTPYLKAKRMKHGFHNWETIQKEGIPCVHQMDLCRRWYFQEVLSGRSEHLSRILRKNERHLIPLDQWFPTFVPQRFLDYNSQKFWPEWLVVKASGSVSLRTSRKPRLRTTALDRQRLGHWPFLAFYPLFHLKQKFWVGPQGEVFHQMALLPLSIFMG